MSNKNVLRAVPANELLTPDPRNPYRPQFEADDHDDIITITNRPMEAAFDAEGDEIIQFTEQIPERFQERPVKTVIRQEEGVLRVEDILADAGLTLSDEELAEVNHAQT